MDEYIGKHEQHVYAACVQRHKDCQKRECYYIDGKEQLYKTLKGAYDWIVDDLTTDETNITINKLAKGKDFEG